MILGFKRLRATSYYEAESLQKTETQRIDYKVDCSL